MKRVLLCLLLGCCAIVWGFAESHAQVSDKPAAQPAITSARLAFFGLLPGKSTRTDVELFLGDPIATKGDKYIYNPPEQAADGERVEAVYLKGSRLLLLLDVVLKRSASYADMAATAGQRLLKDTSDEGYTWEYRTPSFLALGYQASTTGPPQFVDRLRYASPQVVADLFVARGEKAESAKRSDDAITEYEKASRIAPRYAVPYLKIGKFYQEDAPDKALLFFTAATKADYPSHAKAEAHFLIGRDYYKKKKMDLALKAYTSAITEDPHYAIAQFRLGRLYWVNLKQPDKALVAFEKTIECKPEPKLLYFAYYNIGAIQQKQGDFKAAVASFQKALAADPSDPADSSSPRASHRLALNLLKSDDPGEAEKECRRRLAEKEEDVTAMVYLAMALSSQATEQSGLTGLFSKDPHLSESLEWLDKAITAGYSDKAELENSPYLQNLRKRASVSFGRLVSKIEKPSDSRQ